MQHQNKSKSFYLIILQVLLSLLFAGMHHSVYAQVIVPADSLKMDSLRAKKSQKAADNINKQYDFGDLTRNILHPKKKADTVHKGSGITIVPNIAANPTIGAQLGIKAVAGRRLGNDPNTFLSVAATSASITSKKTLGPCSIKPCPKQSPSSCSVGARR